MKIGILTFFNTANIGAKLQALCLKHKVQELAYGAEVKFIDYTLRQNYSEHFDLIIIGSDQVWNPKTDLFLQGLGVDEFFGKNLNSDLIVTYAVSSNGSSNEDLKKMIKDRGFDFEVFKRIAVRDQKTFNLVKEVSGRESEIVLDPALLVENYDFLTMTKTREDHVLVYAIGLKDLKMIEDFAKAVNKPIRYLKGTDFGSRLELFKNAYCVFTNTFHGLLISLALRKKVFILNLITDKIKDVVDRLEISDRVLNMDEKKLQCMTDMDYDKIHLRISVLRERSISYLTEVIRSVS